MVTGRIGTGLLRNRKSRAGACRLKTAPHRHVRELRSGAGPYKVCKAASSALSLVGYIENGHEQHEQGKNYHYHLCPLIVDKGHGRVYLVYYQEHKHHDRKYNTKVGKYFF
jgi:hypothetical protein